MTDITLYGILRSPPVRAARIVCEEKEIPYHLITEDILNPDTTPLATPTLLGLNPLGQIPVMQQGDFTLFECMAICRYLDQNFEGIALHPGNPQDRARMDQWVSAAVTRFDRDLIRNYILPFSLAPKERHEDPAFVQKIGQAQQKAYADLAILDAAYRDREWLAGDIFTLADITMMPMVFYIEYLPGGKEVMAKLPHLARALNQFNSRPSAIATNPFAEAT